MKTNVEEKVAKCKADGCDRQVVAKGCCATHYRRLLRNPKADLARPVAEKRADLVELRVRVSGKDLEALELAASRLGVSPYRLACLFVEAGPDFLKASKRALSVFGPVGGADSGSPARGALVALATAVGRVDP